MINRWVFEIMYSDSIGDTVEWTANMSYDEMLDIVARYERTYDIEYIKVFSVSSRPVFSYEKEHDDAN